MEARKCTFTLEGHDLLAYAKPGMFDYKNDSEREEDTKERNGMFHTWGYDIQQANNSYLPISCAIVEDEDGNVYKVNPENVKFIKE